MVSSRPYSAEYVEAKFSEVGLPLYGVLRSSPVCHPEKARGAAPSLGLIASHGWPPIGCSVGAEGVEIASRGTCQEEEEQRT
jgi:hypothetical protein